MPAECAASRLGELRSDDWLEFDDKNLVRGRRVGNLLIFWPVHWKGCAFLLLAIAAMFVWATFSAIVGLLEHYPLIAITPIGLLGIVVVLTITTHTEEH